MSVCISIRMSILVIINNYYDCYYDVLLILYYQYCYWSCGGPDGETIVITTRSYYINHIINMLLILMMITFTISTNVSMVVIMRMIVVTMCSIVISLLIQIHTCVHIYIYTYIYIYIYIYIYTVLFTVRRKACCIELPVYIILYYTTLNVDYTIVLYYVTQHYYYAAALSYLNYISKYISVNYIIMYICTIIIQSYCITVGFHDFNLLIFNLRVSNPNKLIVDVFLTRCRISTCQGLGRQKNTMKFRKSTVLLRSLLQGRICLMYMYV